MMNKIVKIPVVVSLVAMLSGCIGGETRPSVFYSLTATEADQSVSTVRSGGMSLRVGQFTFPDYLGRPNVITRTADNQMKVDEFDRWAGSLEDDFHRVLGTNLGSLLNSGSVSVYPADTRLRAKYLVQGEINAFEGIMGQQVVLDVRWFVLEPDTDKVLSSRQSVIVEPVAGDDYSSLVLAQSKAVGKLSRDIANMLEQINAGG